jgi:predicted RNA-binding Zn ribbon-like protein
VAWSAARLLTSAEVARVRTCANEDWGWLFVDRSRRGNRRWCDMGECGSRDKARRYYVRKSR